MQRPKRAPKGAGSSIKKKAIKLLLTKFFEEVRERDKRDRERKVSPLLRAADAVLIDNTAMGIEETARLIVFLAEERRKKPLSRTGKILTSSLYTSAEPAGVHERLPPFLISPRAGLGGDNFWQGSTLFFKGSHFVSDFNQDISKKNQVGFSSHRPMTRDDDHLVGCHCHICFGCANLPVDTASGRVVNERVVAIPKRVPGSAIRRPR